MGTRNFAEYNPGAAELGRKNQPGGYVGIDGSGDVLGTFAQRYDTESEILSIVLKAGQIAYAHDTQSWFVGDGTTAGGKFFKQIPQTQNLSLASLVPAPSLGSATSATSIVFPKSLGATYRIELFASFTGDTSNTSNFAIKFAAQSQHTWLLNPQSFGINHVCWYENTYSLIESSFRPTSVVETISGVILSPTTSLTKSAAFAKLVTEFKMDTDPAKLMTPLMAFTPIPRVGSTSAASASVYARCERMS